MKRWNNGAMDYNCKVELKQQCLEKGQEKYIVSMLDISQKQVSCFYFSPSIDSLFSSSSAVSCSISLTMATISTSATDASEPESSPGSSFSKSGTSSTGRAQGFSACSKKKNQSTNEWHIKKKTFQLLVTLIIIKNLILSEKNERKKNLKSEIL